MVILTRDELAGYLKVTPKTIRYLLYYKKIPRVKVGGQFVFIKDDIDNWILKQRQEPSTVSLSKKLFS